MPETLTELAREGTVSMIQQAVALAREALSLIAGRENGEMVLLARKLNALACELDEALLTAVSAGAIWESGWHAGRAALLAELAAEAEAGAPGGRSHLRLVESA